ncbi:MAG: hypothetical protein ABIF40_01560 [archaeon]
MVKRFILSILIVLLCVNIVSASDFTMTAVPQTESVQAGGAIEYIITVENTGSDYSFVKLSTDPFTGLSTSYFDNVIISPSSFILEGHESKDVEVTFMVKSDLTPNRHYQTYLKLERYDDDTQDVIKTIVVYVTSPTEIIEITNVEFDEVKPSETATFEVTLKNNINEQVEDVELYLSTDFFEEHQSLTFFAKQERTETFEIEIPAGANAGINTLSVRVYEDGNLNDIELVDFQISASSEIEEKVEVTKSFLYKSETVTKTNKGNVILEEIYNYDVGRLKRSFVSTSVEPTSTDSDGYHWEFSLSPGETYTINVTTSYRALFLVLVVLGLFGTIAYFWMRKGVVIRKQVLHVRQNAGGTSSMKILLHIRNQGSSSVKNLSMVDYLPRLIKPVVNFGTLKPDNVQKSLANIKLIWHIPELVSGEERILSYEIQTKLDIIGKFTLPSAKVSYRGSKGKVVHSRSNKLDLLGN